MNWLKETLSGVQGFLSWGRTCSFVALVVAVIREFMGADVAHLGLWLGIATGSYTASKVTEMITAVRTSEVK